jgi:hypothetical protein
VPKAPIGRPIVHDPQWKRLHLRMPEDMWDKCVKLGAQFEMTKDRFIYEVLLQWVEEYEKREGPIT